MTDWVVPAVLAAFLASAACATNQVPVRRLDVPALARTGPKTVAVAVAHAPGFVLTSAAQFVWVPGGTMSALMVGTAVDLQHAGQAATPGGAASVDPAAMAGAFALDALRHHLGVRPVAAQDGADLLVDVRTVRWGLIANRENGLWLQYDGTLRLVDRRSGTVLAEGSCSNPAPRSDAEQPPVLLGWVFEDGALLKQELWKTANRCADEYITRVLALPLLGATAR